MTFMSLQLRAYGSPRKALFPMQPSFTPATENSRASQTQRCSP